MFALKVWRVAITKSGSSELLKIYNQCLNLFKNWYCSYSKKPFISFNISITTWLCTVESYEQMSQSSNFNGNDLMVLFSWGSSHLINKLSLISSLNSFASEVKISVWLNSIEQLHSSRWLDIADFLTLRGFPVKFNMLSRFKKLSRFKMLYS